MSFCGVDTTKSFPRTNSVSQAGSKHAEQKLDLNAYSVYVWVSRYFSIQNSHYIYTDPYNTVSYDYLSEDIFPSCSRAIKPQ